MSKPVNIQRRVFVSGRVQGVGFRAAVVEAATKAPDICGYVKNLSDGRVEAVFSGPMDQVLSLVAWCRQGPPHAQVSRLEVIEESFDPTLDLMQPRFFLAKA